MSYAKRTQITDIEVPQKKDHLAEGLFMSKRAMWLIGVLIAVICVVALVQDINPFMASDRALEVQ